MKNTITSPQPTNSKPSRTDDEIGDILIQNWGGAIRYFYDGWHRYDGGVWKDQHNIQQAIWETLKEAKRFKVKPTVSRVNSIENYLKTMLYIEPTQINQDADHINLTNGSFNLKTGLLEPHQPNGYDTTQLEFAYDADASCPQWEKFIGSVLTHDSGVTNPELIAVLQEAFGYSLTTRTQHEKGFWLWGEPARGKSTILHVLKALLGSAHTTLDLNQLNSNPYQLATLQGKRTVVCSEVKANTPIADHILKTLISGEEMMFRQIYGKPFTFIPKVKIWWSMNDLPGNADRSGAMKRRLIIIPFLKPVPDEDRDDNLADKLNKELAGIFNWAIQGLSRLDQQGHFTQAVQVQEVVDAYQQESDTEAIFLNDGEWCVREANLKTQASDLYVIYKFWCQRFGHAFKTSTKVANDWKRLGLQKVKDGSMYYVGIDLTGAAQGILLSIKGNATASKV